MPTAGDVWRPYIKPSLNGLLVLRKRNTIHTSERVLKVQNKIREYSRTEKSPAKIAYDACKADGKTVKKRVYKPGEGYVEKEVCPMPIFKRYLSKAMKEIHSKA